MNFYEKSWNNFYFFQNTCSFYIVVVFFLENALISILIFSFKIVLICFWAKCVLALVKKSALLFFVKKMRSIVFSIDLNLQTRDESSFILKILQLLKNFAIVDELNDTSFSNFNNESINWVVSKIVFVVNDRDSIDFWN